MKLDEIWDEVWTRSKYAIKDFWNFLLFEVAIWILAGAIIAFLETTEICRKIKRRVAK